MRIILLIIISLLTFDKPDTTDRERRLDGAIVWWNITAGKVEGCLQLAVRDHNENDCNEALAQLQAQPRACQDAMALDLWCSCWATEDDTACGDGAGVGDKDDERVDDPPQDLPVGGGLE